MARNNEEVDIELFIGEIKKYEEIWNVAAETYHDRTKKRGAWIQICRVFCEGFDEKEQNDKSEICTKFIQKWKNIKDNYARCMRKKTKSGQAAESGRQYVYSRLLAFLRTAGATIQTQSSLAGDEPEGNPDDCEPSRATETEETGVTPSYSEKSKKRKRDLERTLIDFINAPIRSPIVPAVPDTNPDRSFFESMLSSIRDFTEDQKIQFRCGILNLIKKIRNTPPPQNYPPRFTPYTGSSYPTLSQTSNYFNRPELYESPAQLRIHPTIPFPHRTSASSSSPTTADNETFNDEHVEVV